MKIDDDMILITRETVAKGVYRDVDLHIYDQPSPSLLPSSSTGLGFLFIANPCNNLSMSRSIKSRCLRVKLFPINHHTYLHQMLPSSIHQRLAASF